MLVVDTATPRVSVAVIEDGSVVASHGATADRRHGEVLAPAVAAVCADAGVAPSALDALAVDVGPGLFTGLRVGVATVKGLAAAIGAPVVSVTSLDALAWPWRDEPRPVAAVVDARRGEVFAAVTGPASGVSSRPVLLAPCVLEPGQFADRLAGLVGPGPVLVVGDGARRYADLLPPGALGPEAADHPDAAAWAPLAAAALAAGAGRPAGEVEAVYLRQADVRIGWAERPAPAGGGAP